MAKRNSIMKFDLRVLLVCLGGLTSIVCLSTFVWRPRILLDNHLEVTENEFKSKFKQCSTMYIKSKTKLIQNKGKESRPLPFWYTREIKDNHLFVSNTGNFGRLGNKLFEFAAVFGVSKLNNRTPILERRTWAMINEYFDTRIKVSNFAGDTSNFLTILEHECHTRMDEANKLPPNNVTLGVYLLSRLYFEKEEDELRRELMFKDSVIDTARKYLSESFSPPLNETTFARVAIQVRRGDLLSEHSAVPGFMDLTSEYFLKSMMYFRQCYEQVQFIVMSEDMEWCKENIVGPDVIYSEGNSAGVDLALCSLCDHAITTRGTFSMWAAWFANGITIRPLKSAVPGTEASDKFKLEAESFPSAVVLI